jgi:hypothetical protein
MAAPPPAEGATALPYEPSQALRRLGNAAMLGVAFLMLALMTLPVWPALSAWSQTINLLALALR